MLTCDLPSWRPIIPWHIPGYAAYSPLINKIKVALYIKNSPTSQNPPYSWYRTLISGLCGHPGSFIFWQGFFTFFLCWVKCPPLITEVSLSHYFPHLLLSFFLSSFLVKFCKINKRLLIVYRNMYCIVRMS